MRRGLACSSIHHSAFIIRHCCGWRWPLLRIVTGPFHPSLEQAIVEEVQRIKAADLLAPLAVIVPSDALRRRLKWLFGFEARCALLDVHVLTFYQLTIRLLDERGLFDPTGLRPDFFFRELVHALLKRPPAGLPAAEPASQLPLFHATPLATGSEATSNLTWSSLADMPGAWAALWATLKDLKDACVDTERVLEALEQSALEQGSDDSSPRGLHGIQALLGLYQDLLAERDRMAVWDQDDLAAQAVAYVPSSAFLGRQSRVLYYGFYDLTQVQLDLFRAVARAYPTTLFFPLVENDPAYLFARRFFDRYIRGLSTDPISVLSTPHPASRSADASSPTPTYRIVQTASRWDEVTVVAKEILGLVEERGYAFHEIGVVARSLTGYEHVLPRIFDQHRIPFKASIGQPLITFPYAKMIILLLDLRASGFRREQLIDLLSSPFIRLAALCPRVPSPRPDLWDLASRRLGICKGLEEWGRLAAFSDSGLPLWDDEEDAGPGPRIPPEQVRAACQAVAALAEAVGTLPEVAAWSTYAVAAKRLIERLLDPSAAAALVEPVQRLLDEVGELRRIGTAPTLAEFVSTVSRIMEETQIPISSQAEAGVQVMDAMAARGVPFRALFVLGLNEKVFPRQIQEDPFLRDHLRRVLEEDLGFKIQERLAGYDEERLLFTLLLQSAREAVVLLYQRCDEAGRAQVPSSYLSELKQGLTGHARMDGEADVSVPRRFSDKFQRPLYRPERLTASEFALKCFLDRCLPRRWLKTIHAQGRLLMRGVDTLRMQERVEARLGAYDGITGPLEAYWQKLRERGVSPSALQTYTTCPFRYFARHVLWLEPLLLPQTVNQVGPLELGTLAHQIMRSCWQKLREQGYFGTPPAQVDPFAILEEVAHESFARFAQAHPVGYSLVWELHQERLLEFLRAVLREDLAELSSEGWEPILFEAPMDGVLEIIGPGGIEPFPVSGRLDRVDWSRSRRAYRIIDYKFKSSRRPDPGMDLNLALSAIRGQRLQPPLYLLMADRTLPGQLASVVGDADGCTAADCEGVWFYYLAPNWERPLTRAAFPGDAWKGQLREPLLRVMQHTLDGIREGLFFIYPTGSCERCEFRLICRRTCQPTLRRLRADEARVRPYRELRRVTLAEAVAKKGQDNA